MKLERLTIAGFRGFNEEQTLDFHHRLTVIAAPNSHGKTSVSEALEFLIYGSTSKVEKADSKEEYKDSYRNRHFPKDQSAYIEAKICLDSDSGTLLRVELDPDGATVRRYVDGQVVEKWPFQAQALSAARPFVLQHALKYLLLVPPAERFQGFARLLGLNEVDTVFRAIVGLCTKPSANIPEDARSVVRELETLEDRLLILSELKKVPAALKRGMTGSAAAYKAIEGRADALIGAKSPSDQRIARLHKVRAEASAKIYSGNIALHEATETESRQRDSRRQNLESALDAEFLDAYGHLCVEGLASKLQKEATLLSVGVELLTDDPAKCPLCDHALDEAQRQRIHDRHSAAAAEIARAAQRERSRPRVVQTLSDVKNALKQYEEINHSRTKDLVVSMQPANSPKVIELLGGPSGASVAIVQSAASTVSEAREEMQSAANTVYDAIASCEKAVAAGKPNLSDVEALGASLHAYLVSADQYSGRVIELEPRLSGPAKLFRQAIDALAGTTEISIIIDALEKRTLVERALRVRDVLDGLKDLKKHVEQAMAAQMEAAMSTDLTAAVMKWYAKIKTVGDPDVHFSGFAMDRTKTGDFKSRRLSVKAKSYGVELASAVSSLSESKLNALGLCVSIASAIRSPGPWSFLVIDDPIQSWDDEHETQFIDVLRSLVDVEGKQVIVLTHKGNWAKQVCEGCRTLNGIHYEMTGYTKQGPHIVVVDWSPIEQRLREAETIANDAAATSVRLQQAEEELRLAACQIASRIAKDHLGRDTSPHNMNKGDVRAILNEAGVAADLTDRIQAVFVNADDAHHAPKKYQPNAQRIRQALQALRELAKLPQKVS